MDSFSSLLRFSLLSALIGFAVYCAAQSYQVWRRRHAAVTAGQDQLGLVGRLGAWSTRMLVLGLLGMALALVLREVTQTQGILRGCDLLAVRVPDDGEVTFLAEEGTLAQDAVAARFHSPRLEAEAEEARLQLQRVRADKEILQLQPLAFDPELVRRHQNAATDNRQLQSSLYQLLPTQTSIVREVLQNSLVKQEQIARLNADLNGYRGEMEQARIRRQHSQNQLTRDQALNQQRAVSQADLLDRQRDLRVNQVEETKVQSRLKDMEKEKQRYEDDLSRLHALADDQGKLLQSEVERTRREMLETGRDKEAYAARLAADEQRAHRLRDEELRQLDGRCAEAAARLNGARQRLTITAPFAGNVAFRAPSPRSARRQELLLVLSPEAGFRLEVRLPAGQVEAMHQAGPILLEVDEARLEKRFVGEFRRARQLAYEPSTAVVELACRPNAETVQALIDGEPVKVQVRWHAPLITLPVFQLGALLALAGTLGLVVSRRLAPPVPASVVPTTTAPAPDRPSRTAPPSPIPNGHVGPSAGVPAAPFLDSDVEFGRQGHLLRVLGVRLREAIQAGRIDGDLLRALEWALDRHHARAVRMLSEGLGSDPELTDRAGRLAEQLDGEAEDGADPLAARLTAILRVIGPECSGAAPFAGR